MKSGWVVPLYCAGRQDTTISIPFCIQIYYSIYTILQAIVHVLCLSLIKPTTHILRNTTLTTLSMIGGNETIIRISLHSATHARAHIEHGLSHATTRTRTLVRRSAHAFHAVALARVRVTKRASSYNIILYTLQRAVVTNVFFLLGACKACETGYSYTDILLIVSL